MRNRLIWLLALIVAILALTVAPAHRPAQAQSAPEACQATVQAAMEALTANCTGVGRNTACYANVQVNSTFTQPVPEGYFTQPADLADIVNLQTLTTSPMDEDTGVWGVALMNVQANLPGTLPGQSVTMILLGDTIVGNAVPADEAALPTPPVPVLTSTAAEIFTLPETGAEVAGTVAVSTPLDADGRTQDNQWVRVAVTQPPESAFGGWISAAQLVPFDLAALPVVTAETRTPMQAFVFRTGIGQPTCAEAPNSVVVQGPNNTQVLMNVNGADLNIGSTVQLSSVEGAPQEILETLDLPDEVQDELGDASEENGTACGVMQMNVLSGAVEVNEGGAILPAGNSAFAVFCEEEPPPGSPESTPEPDAPLSGIDFASDWGSFQPMTEEELQAVVPLESLGEDVLNYEITLPDPDDIQPPIINTPTPTPLPPLGGPVTLTPTPTLTPSPTAVPTIPPGTGLSAGITLNTSVNNQTSGVGQPFAVPFSVRISDPYGGPSIGVPVTFTAPASGASGAFAATGTNTQTVNTDSSGNATASIFTSNTIAGSYTVAISAPRDVGFFALAGDKIFAKPAMQSVLISGISASNAPGAPALISAAPGGSGLSAEVTTVYSAQPAALVTDSYGNPVPFVPVTFTAQVGGSGASGDFSGQPTANGVSGFDGIASAPFLTANTIAGAFTVTADGGFATTALGMTNLPAAPAAISAISGGGQSATVTTTFISPLSARVTDAYGNGVPGQPVLFSAPGSGASATFTGSGLTSESVVTDGAGVATSSSVVANTAAGGFSVTATHSTFSDSFGLTNTAGAPATITLTGGNGQSATINSAFASPLSVTVVDAYSNPAAGASVTFTAPGSGASLSFSGSNTVAANGAGQATSPAMTANNTDGNYLVNVSSGGAANTFSLTNLNPQPILTSITPASATAGDAGFTLTIGGAGFVPGMQVTWTGQSALSATVGSATSATVNIPASYIASAGTPSVGLVNPGPGGGAAAGPLTFTINPGTVVTNLNDSGPGSLRSVIANAPAGSTITFAVSGTIILSGGAIRIDKDLTLNGTNPYTVTISGNNTNQIFVITDPGVDAAIYGLRFINGNAGGGDGGAFYVSNGATLNFQYSVMENNLAGTSGCCGKGGAIFVVNATAIIFNSSFRNNTAGADPGNNYGGALALFNSGSLTVTQSCLTGNMDPSNQAIQNFTGTVINATDNWWGNAGGPGAGGANGVSINVNTTPFRTAPVPSVVDC